MSYSRTPDERAEGARRAGDLAVRRGRWTPQMRADLEAELIAEESLRSARTSGVDLEVYVQPVVHYRVAQKSGDYCDADGQDWPCEFVRYEVAR